MPKYKYFLVSFSTTFYSLFLEKVNPDSNVKLLKTKNAVKLFPNQEQKRDSISTFISILKQNIKIQNLICPHLQSILIISNILKLALEPRLTYCLSITCKM